MRVRLNRRPLGVAMLLIGSTVLMAFWASIVVIAYGGSSYEDPRAREWPTSATITLAVIAAVWIATPLVAWRIRLARRRHR